MTKNIEGKVVVITGASGGLGEATARFLCAEGALVAIGARRADRLQALAAELNASGGKALTVTTDVTGHKVRPGNAVYAATKNAMRVISKGLRMEVKP